VITWMFTQLKLFSIFSFKSNEHEFGITFTQSGIWPFFYNISVTIIKISVKLSLSLDEFTNLTHLVFLSQKKNYEIEIQTLKRWCNSNKKLLFCYTFHENKKVEKFECFIIKCYYKSLKAHTLCVSSVDVAKTIEFYHHRCGVYCICSKHNLNQIHDHLAEIFSVTLNCNHIVYFKE